MAKRRTVFKYTDSIASNTVFSSSKNVRVRECESAKREGERESARVQESGSAKREGGRKSVRMRESRKARGRVQDSKSAREQEVESERNAKNAKTLPRLSGGHSTLFSRF